MTDYLYALICGGLLCVIGQILIDKTKLTPARILVGYVVAGVILGRIGIYEPLAEFAGAGATVPLSGFGNLRTEAGRYSYAPLFPETFPPTPGRIFIKYKL